MKGDANLMLRFSRLVAVLVVLSTTSVFAAPSSVLPPATTVSGWKQTSAPRTYTSSNLWDLVNGEADAIMAYGFISCSHGEYGPKTAKRPVVTVDVYDLGTPLNAFGLFSSSDRGGTSAGVGTESVRIGSTGLNFWKGRYLVRTTLIGSGAGTAANKSAQMALARASAARIPGGTGKPVEIRRLPSGYQAGTEKYVRKNFAGQSFLNEVVVARYPSLGAGSELFIAKTGSASTTAFRRYKEFLGRRGKVTPLSGVGNEAFVSSDRYSGNTVVARKGGYVVGATRARNLAQAKALVSKAAQGLR